MKGLGVKLVDKLSPSNKSRAPKKDSDVLRYVRVCIPAQSASLSPPLGPALGQLGINISDFCKQFNDKTKSIDSNVMLPTTIIVYRNKKFQFFFLHSIFCHPAHNSMFRHSFYINVKHFKHLRKSWKFYIRSMSL